MAARAQEEKSCMAEGSGLEAPIAAVTVFRDGARVQRGGAVSVEPGLWPIVVGDLQATWIRTRSGSRPADRLWRC